MSSHLGKAQWELRNSRGNGEITSEVDCEVGGDMGEEVGW